MLMRVNRENAWFWKVWKVTPWYTKILIERSKIIFIWKCLTWMINPEYCCFGKIFCCALWMNICSYIEATVKKRMSPLILQFCRRFHAQVVERTSNFAKLRFETFGDYLIFASVYLYFKWGRMCLNNVENFFSFLHRCPF